MGLPEGTGRRGTRSASSAGWPFGVEKVPERATPKPPPPIGPPMEKATRCEACGRGDGKHELTKRQGKGPAKSVLTQAQLDALGTLGPSLRTDQTIYAHGGDLYDTSAVEMPP